MLEELSDGRQHVGGRMEDASLLQERVAVVIDQVMVEPRERPVVAKGIPRGRVTAPTIVDPVERRVGCVK